MYRHLIAVAALLLAACKSPPPPAPASGADASLTESSFQTPRFPGRPYRLELPTDLDAHAPSPVLVALHGFGGNGAGMVEYFGLKPAVARHRTILVVVDGTRNPDGASFWNAGGACCNLYDQAVDDVAYLDAVLDDVGSRYAVDPRRLYVVGHSNGGFMAYRYACERSERVAGIVSLAGAGLADEAQCHPKAPVAVLQVHGDQDELVPYAGGSFSSPELVATLRRNRFPLPPGGPHTSAFAGAHATVQAWAMRDGCAAAEETSPTPLDVDARILGPETVATRHPGCRGGAAELWTIKGGGHVPSLGPSWAEQILAFLEAHPKP
jgi:polyhydroxybutyrate depolymerase